MTYQDVLSAMIELFPITIVDGYDINRESRVNYFHMISAIKINNLRFVNERILRRYAPDQENAWSWAYDVMTFLYNIEAIKPVNDMFAEIQFTL